MGGYPFRFPRSSRWMPNCRACRVYKRDPVIPGRREATSPESILPIVVMDSGLATLSRPGMTAGQMVK